jgi:tetratricopeptide (TPR) repeat protein
MRSGLTSRALIVAVLCGLVALPTAANADKPTPAKSNQAQAADLFKKSVDAYRRGAFKEAIDLLNEAYALDPQPVLLYNLARAHEGLGDLDLAISTYEKYLQQEPNAPDKGAIEQRLVTLRRQRDERNAAAKQKNEKPPPPPPPKNPPPPPPREPSVLPYVVAGVGVVGLGLGTAFGLMATGKNDDAAKEPVQAKSIELKDSADGLATASTVSFIVGGVLLAAGAAWWVLDTQASSSQGAARGRLRAGIAPGFVGLAGTLP